MKQPLLVFSELPEELACSWKGHPYSGRSAITSLESEAMESLGLSHMLLHPRQPKLSSRGPAFPSKADCFQSTLTETAYRGAVLSARALNMLSLLKPYQAELCGDFAQTCDPAVFADIPTVTNLCLQRWPSRPRGKYWGLWCCRSTCGGSTPLNCWRGRTISRICQSSLKGSSAWRLPPHNAAARLKRRRMRRSSFVFCGNL